MNKKLVAVLVSVVMMLALLTACDDSSFSSMSTQQSDRAASSSAANSSDEEQATTDEGDIGDYHIKILDAETGIKDYEGNPTIGVKFEFTNNAEEATSFDAVIYACAYQDGVELDFTAPDTESEEYNNAERNIKKGVTIVCEQYFVLTSDKSDVEVEVEEAFSFGSTKLEKNFKIGD